LLLAWFLPFEDNHNFILPAIAYHYIYNAIAFIWTVLLTVAILMKEFGILLEQNVDRR